MNPVPETRVRPVLDAVAQAGLADEVTVVLVGSGARGVRNTLSDLDVLVLSAGADRIRLKRPGDIHLQQDSRAGFLRRLEDGDDYPGWALRFGIPLRDPDGWWAEHVAAERKNPHWPDWHPKIEHAGKRARIASTLLDTGDVDAASEELLLAVSHVARATLLKCGIFPLSRPELPAQIEDVDTDIAQLLERLMRDEVNAEDLRAGERLLQQRLNDLRQGFS